MLGNMSPFEPIRLAHHEKTIWFGSENDNRVFLILLSGTQDEAKCMLRVSGNHVSGWSDIFDFV